MIYRLFLVVAGATLLFGCGDSPPTSHPIQSQTSHPDTAYFQIYGAQLAQLEAADQQDREKIFVVFRHHGFKSVQADTANQWLMRRDSLHLMQFLALEKRYGWPQQSQVGAEGVRSLLTDSTRARSGAGQLSRQNSTFLRAG